MDIEASLGLATTVVSFVVANSRNCTESVMYPLVAPLEAHVVDLSLSLSNGCTMRSTVKTEADAQELFLMMDADHDGEVSSEEFLEGFMKMRGAASAKDLLTLTCKLDRVGHSLHRSMAELGAKVDQLARSHEQLAEAVRAKG